MRIRLLRYIDPPYLPPKLSNQRMLAYSRTLKNRILLSLLLPFSVGCSSAIDNSSYPRKAVKVIVPFDAGGGSDTFTRVIQQAITKNNLLSQPLVVVNIPGAGGSIGSRRVKQARPDGYTLLQLHEGIITNLHSGNTTYGPTAFEPIIGTGSMPHVIAVKSDSGFETLPALLLESQHHPDSVLFAVGIGAPSHFTGLLLQDAFEGAQFRFSQSGGGAKRLASLLGGHTHVTTFSLAEFVDFKESGLRALAILSEERHPEAPSIPTAIEQGIDAQSANMHFWWAPKGTSQGHIDVLADTIAEAMETPEAKAFLRSNLIDPTVLRGQPLRASLIDRENKIAQIALPQEPKNSNSFVLVLVLSTALAAVACMVKSLKVVSKGSKTSSAASRRKAVTVMPSLMAAMLGCFVLVLQFELTSFFPATLVFATAACMLLQSSDATQGVQRKNNAYAGLSFVSVAYSLLFGIVISGAVYLIFQQILFVDLP